MGQLVQFDSHGKTAILIQAKGVDGTIVATGKLDDSIAIVNASIDKVFALVSDVVDGFRSTVKLDALASAELELGLQVTAKGTIYVAEVSGEATLNVKLIFKGAAA